MDLNLFGYSEDPFIYVNITCHSTPSCKISRHRGGRRRAASWLSSLFPSSYFATSGGTVVVSRSSSFRRFAPLPLWGPFWSSIYSVWSRGRSSNGTVIINFCISRRTGSAGSVAWTGIRRWSTWLWSILLWGIFLWWSSRWRRWGWVFVSFRESCRDGRWEYFGASGA